MNTFRPKTLVLAAMLAVSVFTASAMLNVGASFPDLAAFKLDGKLPATRKGKIVIIDFWASWCGPCKESFPVLNELQKKYGDKGLVILGVNEDEDKSDMQSFLKDHPATFTVVHDDGQKLVAKAGIETMPSSFVLDGAGVVRFTHNGFHGSKTREQYEQQIESLLKK